MAECDEIGNSNMSGLPVNDAQSELAKQAWQEFNKQQYDNCINILNKLLVNRSKDSKVIHNKAVAEFYQSKFTKIAEFKQNLATVCHLEHINLDNLNSLDDVEHSAVLYNQAVVLYHHRQYKAALSIMDKLFNFVEPIEENLTRKCLFLLVELYLQTHQPEKAMGMVSYVERMLYRGTKRNTSPSGDKGDKNESQDSSATNEIGNKEQYRPSISLYKTRCLIMMKSLKACKREIKVLMSNQLTVNNNPSVVYLKSNFEYLRGSSRKVLKMLATVPQTTVISESGHCLPVMYYNNLGCIHFNTRKHHLGAFYFRKAVSENESAVKNLKKSCDDPAKCGAPLQTIGLSRHHELLYNMGVQLLHCRMPQAAFDCLIQAVQVYQINPRLWLRLAECCIMNFRESNEDDKKLKKRMDVIQGSVASGVHRKLILGSTTKHVTPSHNPAIPAPSLEFAALCLRNALLLLPEHPHQTEVSEENTETSKSEIFLVPAPPSNPMRAAEVSNLRCSILTASAYVSLCLNDHLIALNYANSLLSQTRLSGAQRYLAHLYASEALVHLDRIPDAIQHLNPEFSVDVSVYSQEQKSDQDKNDKMDKNDRDLADTTETKGALLSWTPAKPQKAQAVLLYNLATTLAIRGEYSKALKHLGESSKLICQPFPAQMYCLKLYLDLIEGRRATAQYIIKESFGHVTPNRVDLLMMNKKSLSSDQLLP
ncbi:CCR4-NOT transcription complex subunit 10-like [Argonauta hians]